MKSIVRLSFFALILSFALWLCSCELIDGLIASEPEDMRTSPCRVCDTGEYDISVTKYASTFGDGEQLFVCNVCGDSYTETVAATGELRILSIGDYSSLDSIAYLSDMLLGMGVPHVTVGMLNHAHTTGAEIASQNANIASGAAAYTLSMTKDGEMDIAFSITLDEGISSTAWDFIVVQQCIPYAGDESTYSGLDEFIGHIDSIKTNPNAKILLNMLWAYETDSNAKNFADYGRDQTAMYSAIASATESAVKTSENVAAVIPSGTVIQNLRGADIGERLCDKGIRLDSEVAKYALSLLWCSAIMNVPAESIDFMPDENAAGYDVIKNRINLLKKAVTNAMESKYEVNAPKPKSIKILIFGNSYGNDATAYLERMLTAGGYDEVVIGHVGESSMAINDHYYNIDDDPTNDYIYNGHTFSVHYKTVNGKKTDLAQDYKKIVADEPWDYVLFYQGPNSTATLTERKYYSELDGFVTALRANMTNPNGKIIYYMPWAHNVSDTNSLYRGIVDITNELITHHPYIDGVIPAATLIQNLRTSYLTDGAAGDITRDWGHLNYGVGRYSMALLWYVYLTGGAAEDITFMPTRESEGVSNTDMAALFTDVNEDNIKVIREAIENAIATPYEITSSKYIIKP